MTGRFVVDAEVLRRHAGRVGQVSSDVASAQAAAGSTGLHVRAFGVLCSFLPAIVSGVDGAAREAMDSAKAASDAVVEELGSMAKAFDDADVRVDELLRAVGRALER